MQFRTDKASIGLKIIFILPVWGQKFIDQFSRIALPFLLTDGNLRHFSGRDDALFLIATKHADYLRLAEQDNFRELSATIDTEVLIADGLTESWSPHEMMSELYKMGMSHRRVVPGETAVVFLTADSIWSDGSFRRLEHLVDQGKKLVAVAGLRTVYETVREDLALHLAPDGPGRAIPNRTLVSIALRNLHPMSAAHDVLSREFLNAWPSHIYWRLGDNLLLAHCFHLHPLAVVAPKAMKDFDGTVDGGFLKKLNYDRSQIHVVENSDEIFGMEMSPADRDWGIPGEDPRLNSIVYFSIVHCNRYHRHFFLHRITMMGEGEPVVSELIRQHEANLLATLAKRNSPVRRVFATTAAWSLRILRGVGAGAVRRRLGRLLGRLSLRPS